MFSETVENDDLFKRTINKERRKGTTQETIGGPVVGGLSIQWATSNAEPASNSNSVKNTRGQEGRPVPQYRMKQIEVAE